MRERRGVKRVVSPLAKPLERSAKCLDLVLDFLRLAILGVQRIALLLEDLVNAFVLVADSREKLPELLRIVYPLGRQLPQSTRRAFHDELCKLRRIAYRGKRLRQA